MMGMVVCPGRRKATNEVGEALVSASARVILNKALFPILGHFYDNSGTTAHTVIMEDRQK